MKKIFSIILLFTAVTMFAQDVPTSFPRKFLIEHFTGDQCGYCPGGMYAITDYIQNQNPNAIWVSHHYGYNNDEYSISESGKIGKMLGVQGAPNMTLNRAKQSQGTAFHPGYLPDIVIKDDTVAAASVVINQTYNAETRELEVTVSGQVADTTAKEYLLSVLIKENQLVGKQADYQYSWKSATWKEYMHARVVRDFLTSHFGDTVQVVNQAYSHTLTYTVSDKWIAENCCVVAYLTPLAKKPVINAEQAPLVAGTEGGEQYYPYGITEGQAPNKTIAFDTVQVTKVDDNVLELIMIANKSIKTGYGTARAVGIVYINTDSETLQPGTYPIKNDNSVGSIIAGYRIDEKATLGGSLLVYALASDLNNGIISVAHMWRMNSGDMMVEEDGNISYIFKTYGGATINSTYGEPEVAVENIVAPENKSLKIMQNGRIFILKDGTEYDILGNTLNKQ